MIVVKGKIDKFGFVVLLNSIFYCGIVNEFTIPTTPSVFAYAKPPPSAREAK